MRNSKALVAGTCLLAFACIYSIWQSQCHFNLSFWAADTVGTTRNIAAKAINTTTRPPQDADGCYHVFIDVGANIGVHARFVLEPHKYPKATVAHDVFNREFGTNRSNQDICAFEIEPNPVHAKAHERNAAAYKAMGWRYHYMPYAASDQDNTTLEFYHQPGDLRSTRNVSEWGFSSNTARKSGKIEKVKTLHLSKWLETHVRGRIIPQVPHGWEQAHEIGPRVVMKMDIEGAEWEVLPDLITSGALCDSVDFWFGEFHNFQKELVTNFYRPLRQSIKTILEASKNCRTKFQVLDDEAYLLDGMPLPNITES